MPPTPDRQVEAMRVKLYTRSMWAVMAAAHIPALLSLTREALESGLDPSRVSVLVGLSMATLFCMLKLWGVRCLRLATDRRSLITIAAAVMLIHAEAITSHYDEETLPKSFSIAGSVLFVGGLSRVQSLVRSLGSAAPSRSLQALAMLASTHSPGSNAFAPFHNLVAPRVRIPRAPPV